MKKTQHPVPVADLSDEVWTIDHIAAYLRMRRPAAYARIAQAGFPVPCTGNERYRRWLAVDVKAYFASAQPAPVVRRPATVAVAQVNPGKATFRPRKKVAA